MTELKDISDHAWERSNAWFPQIHALSTLELFHHVVLGLVGEAGEVANVVKKANRNHSLPDPAVLGPELADVLVYLMHVAAVAGVDLEKEYWAKSEFNERRFGRD